MSSKRPAGFNLDGEFIEARDELTVQIVGDDDGKLIAQGVHAAYYLLDGQWKDRHPTDVQQVVGAPLKSAGGAHMRAAAGAGGGGELPKVANNKA